MYLCLSLTAGHVLLMNRKGRIDLNGVFYSGRIKEEIGISGNLCFTIVNLLRFNATIQLLFVRVLRRVLMQLFF